MTPLPHAPLLPLVCFVCLLSQHAYAYTQVPVPHITRLFPPLGHVSGGTAVTITGAPFVRSARIRVRFACNNDIQDVDASYVSPTTVVVTTPSVRGACTSHVTASNDGERYSGAPLVFVPHSGSFLQFVFDASDPGCPGCRDANTGKQADTPVAERVREHWEASVGGGAPRGPYTGGTDVLIHARRYTGNHEHFLEATQPTGGPGATSVYPSRGQPLPTGTFYPGRNLQCLFTCRAPAVPFYGMYGYGSFYGLPIAPSRASEAFWIDYNRIRCVSPAIDESFADAEGDVRDGELSCTITVTNGGGTFDDVEDSETGQMLANAAHVSFTYARRPPSITDVSVDAGAGAAAPQRDVGGFAARSPMHGGAELTIRGVGFLPSPRLSCRFSDASTRASVVPAIFDGPNQVRCLTPPRPEVHVARSNMFDGLPPAPCVASEVTVSNNGVRFSRVSPSSFVLYCDVHVDPSGDDVDGIGTPDAPFRSIQRAIDASLRNPRRRLPHYDNADGVQAPSQPGEWVNADRVVVHNGIYSGPANTYLDPRGRVVEVVARSARRDEVVVDCGGGAGLLAPGISASMLSDASSALSVAPSLSPGSLLMRGVVARNCGVGADGELDPHSVISIGDVASSRSCDPGAAPARSGAAELEAGSGFWLDVGPDDSFDDVDYLV
ncbi:IPT/TIG domain-containing protein [Pseudoscourfieldia marina]